MHSKDFAESSSSWFWHATQTEYLILGNKALMGSSLWVGGLTHYLYTNRLEWVLRSRQFLYSSSIQNFTGFLLATIYDIPLSRNYFNWEVWIRYIRDDIYDRKLKLLVCVLELIIRSDAVFHYTSSCLSLLVQ